MKIFLIVIIVLTAILLIPVSAKAKYDNAVFLEIRYLFFKKTILPKPPKKAAAAKKSSSAPKKKKPKKPKPDKPKRKIPLGVWEIIELIPKAVEMLLPPIRKLLKRTVIGGFSLEMVVLGDDAADTAIKFGKVNGAVFYAAAVLDRVMTLKTKRIDIHPGFTAEKSEIRAEGEVKAYPLAVIIAAVQLGVSALILLIPALKKKKRKTIQNKTQTGKEEPNGKEKSSGRSS